MRNPGNAGNVGNHALIGGRGDDNELRFRVSAQPFLHALRCHTACRLKARQDRGGEVLRMQVVDIEGVVKRLVAVARREDRVSPAGAGCHGRQHAAGASVHKEPGVRRAVQRGGAIHGAAQDAVRVVQVVKALDLRDVEAIRVFHLKQSGVPLVAGHMHGANARVAVAAQRFQQFSHWFILLFHSAPAVFPRPARRCSDKRRAERATPPPPCGRGQAAANARETDCDTPTGKSGNQ